MSIDEAALDTPRCVSESYWEAECRRDVQGILGHYHENATYEGPDGLRCGHQAIEEAYEASARDFPGLEVRIVREFPAGMQSALEFEAILTDPRGKRFRIRGVNVVEVRSGRFTSVRSYEDPPSPL